MREMKYIVARNLENDKEEIFIFPKSVNHDCMAEVLTHIKNQSGWGKWIREPRLPVSAGFTDGNTCYGRSESLNLDSRPQDKERL